MFLAILRQYRDPRIIAIGCIAYANGLPHLLTGATLGVWLKSYGLNYTTIGLFGLFKLPYAFKPLWAPILDHLHIPVLHKLLGQRRSWLCVMQVAAIIGLVGMVAQSPIHNLSGFIACGLLVTISTASQHILLLAYQKETLQSRDWGVGEGMGVFTYRMAMLTGGSVALSLATIFSWQEVYLFITSLMLIGLVAVLIMGEPEHLSSRPSVYFAKKSEWLRYALINPFKDFMRQKGWLAILIFMLIYRLPENLLGMMQTLFLLDLGFTYLEISAVAKTFGMVASICGGFIGGYWIRSYGYQKTLFWGAFGHGIACLIFLLQEKLGANLPFLYVTIGIEHFFSGVMLTGFFSYQLVCTSLAFAATQLALLTSLVNISGVLAKPMAGIVIDNFGWIAYLWLVVISAIPGMLWVYKIPFTRR